jgi:hypothetical protein
MWFLVRAPSVSEEGTMQSTAASILLPVHTVRSVLGLMALLAFAPDANAQTSCVEAIPKDSTLIPAGEERIEGGKRCFVKADKDSEPTLHTIIWDEQEKEPATGKKTGDATPSGEKGPSKAPPPNSGAGTPAPTGCEPTEQQLREMWQHLADARAHSTLSIPSGSQTFAVAYVLNERCELVGRVHGAFNPGSGVHAEGQILEQLKSGGAQGSLIKKGVSVFWMIDQFPCTTPSQQPPGGHCSKRLKLFPQQRKVGQRVFVVATAQNGTMGSPKTFAQKAQPPETANYVELTDYTFPRP